MSDKTWLTVTDATAHASVSRDTVYSAVERAELRHVRVGGRRTIRLRSEWVDEWLERFTREPSVGAATPEEHHGTL